MRGVCSVPQEACHQLVFPTSRCNGAGGTSVLPPAPWSQSSHPQPHRQGAGGNDTPPSESALPHLFLGSALPRTHSSYRNSEVAALPQACTTGQAGSNPAVPGSGALMCPQVPPHAGLRAPSATHLALWRCPPCTRTWRCPARSSRAYRLDYLQNRI